MFIFKGRFPALPLPSMLLISSLIMLFTIVRALSSEAGCNKRSSEGQFVTSTQLVESHCVGVTDNLPVFRLKKKKNP